VSVLASSVSGVAESLFATLFPSDCRFCGTPLINISRLPVCKPCLSEIHAIEGGVCSVCGERLLTPFALGVGTGIGTDGAEVARCGLCRKLAPSFVKAVAYGSYDGGLRELIHLLKYDQVRPAATVLGGLLAEAVRGLESFAIERPMVVPVPLHTRKLRQRGFNQSELIAQEFIKLSLGKMMLPPRVLQRRRETESQIGLTRHQRRENIRGAFIVPRPQEIAGREILLVDDVFTTGTTVSECARVLLRAGASKVFVATVARTLKNEVKGINLSETEDQTMAAAS
jgi:ComF family protein